VKESLERREGTWVFRDSLEAHRSIGRPNSIAGSRWHRPLRLGALRFRSSSHSYAATRQFAFLEGGSGVATGHRSGHTVGFDTARRRYLVRRRTALVAGRPRKRASAPAGPGPDRCAYKISRPLAVTLGLRPRREGRDVPRGELLKCAALAAIEECSPNCRAPYPELTRMRRMSEVFRGR